MVSAQDMVDFYTAAEQKVLRGQSVRMGERMLTMADLEQIRAGRREWQDQAIREGNRGRGVARANFGGVT